MQTIKKTAIVAATACILGLAMSGASQAQDMHTTYPAHHYYPTQGYSVYQNPDGSCDSLADLTRDIRGIPCGIECTREAQARWSHQPYRYSYGE